MSLTSYRAAPPRANSGRRRPAHGEAYVTSTSRNGKGAVVSFRQDCHRWPSYNCRMSEKPGLGPQQAVGQALRDIARHILTEGRTAVEDRKRVEAVAVHDFRAAMKSLARLPAAGRAASGAEERGWRTEARDMARMLAGARDAQAALDAVADTDTTAPSHRLSSQSWETIRTQAGGYARRRRRPRASHRRMRKRISAAIDRAEARVERWPLDDAHVRRRCRRAAATTIGARAT